MDDLKLALALQAIENELAGIRKQMGGMDTIPTTLIELGGMLENHEKSLRGHSGQFAALEKQVGEHQSFVDRQTAGHSVGRWVAGLFFLMTSALTAGSMMGALKFYYDMGSLSAQISDIKTSHAAQIADLKSQILALQSQQSSGEKK